MKRHTRASVGAWVVLLAACGGSGGDDDAEMSVDAVAAGLATYADDINDADNLRFDDFSNLVDAVVVERQITIRGETLPTMDQLAADYLASRETQGLNQLCSDEANRELLGNGATYVFNWFSSDDQSIGMVTIRGAEVCAAAGF